MKKPTGLILFAAVFVVVFLAHLPLVNLPYYWDEAGYFIPAAHDILFTNDFVPRSTLSNAHPPLVMCWLALCWKLFGFHIAVARGAMLAVASLALCGVFRLSERVANREVAWATLLSTALYPVFFAQSSLAHLDMGVAALTVWGLVFYLPPRDDAEHASRASLFARENVRRAIAILLFALAGVTKETAVLTPLALCGWELLCLLPGRWRERTTAICLNQRRTILRSLALLLTLVPLALWFAYHRHVTGYVFGNPEYFRYNVESTVNLSRIFETLWGRLRHVTVHMNLWVLTLATVVAMFFPARRDGEQQERRRIEVSVQLVFALLIVAHVAALSVVGGAVLARYMLPVYPLVLLICVSTLRRRVRHWRLVVGVVCLAFITGLFVNPPYSFPWEENLAYRDFVVLHTDAAHFLADKYPDAHVLTMWPASDELKNPYFGYLDRPLKVFSTDSFRREDLERIASQESQYDVALLFSTHGGLAADEIAKTLGGRIVYREERKGQWVAVMEKAVARE
ncbi:MAG: hypothetical protein WCD76_08725 [Pyrinomonadaceae bacterium]